MKIEIQDGLVVRDGKKIGEIQDETCFLYGSVPPVVRGAINKAAGVKLTFEVWRGDPMPSRQPEPEDSGSDNDLHPVASIPDTPELTDEQLQAALSARGMCIAPIDAPDAIPVPPVERKKVSSIEVLQRRAKMGQIPEPPPTDACLGNRTPEFVEWVKANTTPEEFEEIYRNRRLPTWQEHKAELARKSKGILPGEEVEGRPRNPERI